jgi:hypothetical protein
MSVAKGCDRYHRWQGGACTPVALENEETKERKGKSILLTKAVFVCSGMNTIQHKSRESVIIAS